MKAQRHSNVFNLPRLIRAGELTTVAKPLTLYLFDPIIDGTSAGRSRSVEPGRSDHVPVLTGWVQVGLTDFIEIISRTPLILAVRITTKAHDGLHYFQSQPISQRRMWPRVACSTSYTTSWMASGDNQSIKLLRYIHWKNIVSLQGQQMYGEARYICTTPLIFGTLRLSTYQYVTFTPYSPFFNDPRTNKQL